MISDNEDMFAYSVNDSIFLSGIKNGSIDASSIRKLKFEPILNDRISKISFSSSSEKLAISTGNKLIEIDLLTSQSRIITETSDPIYWFSWGKEDSVIYFLSGLSTEHKQMSSNGSIGFASTDFERRIQGHFDLNSIIISNSRIINIESKRESVTSVMPSLSSDGKYLAIINNSLNSVKKVFIISTENYNTTQLTKKGIYSFPARKPM